MITRSQSNSKPRRYTPRKTTLHVNIDQLRLCIIQWQTEIISVFDPIFPDTCYHLTHYWYAAADIPVASDNPA
ncbi:MAG: hypothetical protein E7I52_05240, partial [Klebsiella michiganensis]|nr:hypothetical protein [Klebsiella michiganensis]